MSPGGSQLEERLAWAWEEGESMLRLWSLGSPVAHIFPYLIVS